jgi:outer membrane lipoprotein-sorting protein
MRPLWIACIACALAVSDAPTAQSRAPTTQPDPRAEALLAKVEVASRAAQTLTADMSVSYSTKAGTRKSVGTVKLMKPNFARIQLNAGRTRQIVASDGRDCWTLYAPSNQYQESSAHPDDVGFQYKPISFFFAPRRGRHIPSLVQLHYLGTERIGRMEYRLLQLDWSGAAGATTPGQVQTDTWYIAPDNLIHRTTTEVKQEDGSFQKTDVTLKNVRIGHTFHVADFAFVLPNGAKRLELPADTTRLLPVGVQAPPFVLPTPGGGQISLRESLAGKKALLVNFWFYG